MKNESPTLSAPPLSADNLVASYGGDPVLHDVSIDIPQGQILSIIGPNGSGKSTLLKCLARLHQPDQGSVRLDDVNIEDLPTRAVARRLAFLPQHPIAPPGLPVRQLVGLGRHPHRRWLHRDRHGPKAINNALDLTGIQALSHRLVETLSGGQRQRAWIALTLAQGADILLLDEPTNHLDPAHRSEVMQTLKQLMRESNRSLVLVLHDLTMAANVSDRIAVMDRGRLVTQGHPEEVLNAALLKQVYGVTFSVLSDPNNGRPVPIPCI